MNANVFFSIRAIYAGTLAVALVLSLAACDFERDRGFAPAGVLGFLAQISSPNQIVVGRYCGQTGSFTGAAGGYAVIDGLCQTACGSTTAHLCSGPELQGGFASGLLPPTDSWYGGFIIHIDQTGSTINNDCGGWKFATGTSGGSLVTAALDAPNRDFCNNSHPFACCDYVVLAQ